MGRALVALVLCAVSVVGAGCGGGSSAHTITRVGSTATGPGEPVLTGIHKIRHVVIIMQENRSFDTYFGTYPGAAGIPGLAGNPGAVPCIRDPLRHSCSRPFHDRQDLNVGGPHGARSARADINGGKMNGFVTQQQQAQRGCERTFNPLCGASRGLPDAMGYHTGADIPNYWAYARDFVLQDHMFESNASWSLPQHLYMVSEWSAHCTVRADPMSCTNALENPGDPGDFLRRLGVRNPTPADYAWTDLTYLLHRYGVSWAYYVFKGNEPDCADNQAMSCAPVSQGSRTPGIWNPLPYFDTVQQDGQLGNIESLSSFYTAARAGTLPAVSWVVPNARVSEHPPGLVTAGQTYVTGLINAIMRSPDWKSTAIFVSWDDWGGFYDHVKPPRVDENGYGLRVPGLVISPYASKGYIDHQTLSFDAYVKFIEDDFLRGQRLDPSTDGRPDPRPDVREALPQLGDLATDFNFTQAARAPILLPLAPRTDLVEPSSAFGGLLGQSAGRLAAQQSRLLRRRLGLNRLQARQDARLLRALLRDRALRPVVVRAAAAYLGLAPGELRGQLAAGQTLGQIARGEGRSLPELRQAVIAALTAQVRQAIG
jgi:phospholipase C